MSRSRGSFLVISSKRDIQTEIFRKSFFSGSQPFFRKIQFECVGLGLSVFLGVLDVVVLENGSKIQFPDIWTIFLSCSPKSHTCDIHLSVM